MSAHDEHKAWGLQSVFTKTKQLVWFLMLINISLYFFRPLAFPDIWWQWDDGRQILHTFKAPEAPRLTFGEAENNYIDEYVIFEAALYLCGVVGGLGLVTIIYWMIAIAPFVITYFICLRRTRQDGLFAFILFLICVLAMGYIHQRPAVLGNLFLFLLGMLLARDNNIFQHPRSPVIFAFLFCLWSNTHSSYVIGLFILGLYLAEKVIRERFSFYALRQAILLLGIAGMSTAIHPYGLERWVFTLEQYKDVWGYIISSEMWPSPLTFQLILAAGFIASLLIYFQKERFTWWWLVAVIAVLFLSLTSYRFSNHIGALFLVALIFSSRSTSPKRHPFVTTTIIASNSALGIFLLIVIFAQLYGVQKIFQEDASWMKTEISSVSILDGLSMENKKQAILSDTVVSAYAYYLQRQNLITLNDTGMARYSQNTKRYYYYLSSFPDAFEIALDQLHIDKIVICNRDPLWAAVLNARKDWKLASVTKDGLLYYRAPAQGLTADKDAAFRDFLATIDGEIKIVFTAHLLPDSVALDFLKINSSYMNEGIYQSIDRTLMSISTDEIEQFLKNTPNDHLQPVIQLLILKRLGRFLEAEMLAKSWKPHGTSWSDCVPKAEAFMDVGNFHEARRTLDFLYPKPTTSPLYETLRFRLMGTDAIENKVLGEKLLWDAASQAWFKETTPKWNQHMEQFDLTREP